MRQGTFQAIYDSPWHSPLLFWAAALAFAVTLAARRPTGFLWRYLALFTLAIVADAWATGALTPLGNTVWMTPVAILFVVLGDLRYFLLLERFRRGSDGTVTPAGAARIVAVSLVVPVASTVARHVLDPRDGRVTFLVYELMFLVMALAIRFLWLPRRATEATAAWLGALTSFEIVQYALWALADIVILSGVEAGFLLRLVPNTLYYAAFLPYAYATAPREVAS